MHVLGFLKSYSDNTPSEAIDGETGSKAYPPISTIRRMLSDRMSREIAYGDFIKRVSRVMIVGLSCIIAHF
jgi:hypothetical protein